MQSWHLPKLEFYGGDGEKFLYAYFKFVVENAVMGVAASKAADVLEGLWALARAKKATKVLEQVLEERKIFSLSQPT